MPTPFDNAALFGAGSCGCHQAVFSPYALPDGSDPLILADFKNGVYMTSGQAVTIGDILGENEAVWGAFDPALVQAGVGLVCDTDFPDSNVALLGDMLELARGEMTMVVECDLNADTFALFGFAIRSLTLSEDQHSRFQMNGINGGDPGQVLLVAKPDNGSGPGGVEFGGLLPGMIDGINRVAWTKTATGLAISINGGAVTTYAGAPYILKDDYTDFAGFFITGSGCVLTEFVVASPQDDADLPTLSTP